MTSYRIPLIMLLSAVGAALSFGQEAFTYRLSTYAGTPRSAAGDSTATTVLLRTPFGVAHDRQGNLYVADYENHVIRRVAAADGKVSTIAGTGVQGHTGNGGPGRAAQIQFPRSLAIDAARQLLYFSEQAGHRIRRVDLETGIISLAAGDGTARFNGDGQAGPATSFNEILGLSVNAAGDVFICDTNNHRIRKLAAGPGGTVTTVAGSGTAGYVDGPAAAARLNRPSAVAAGPNGGVYFFDINNTRVRLVENGTVSTIAGNPTGALTQGPALQVRFQSSTGIALDAAGANLYVTDERPHRISRIRLSDKAVSVVAGSGVAGFSGDGGAASQAVLNTPTNVMVDAAGGVIFADSFNHRIRRIDAASGNISTIAGGGSKWGLADASRAEAVFDGPSDVALDAEGLLVVDRGNCSVRLVGPERVTYLAGAVGACQFPNLLSAVRDSAKNLFWSGPGGLFHKPSNSAAAVSRVPLAIVDLVMNAAGNSLFFSQADQGNARIWRAATAGLAGTGPASISPVAGTTPGREGDDGPATAAKFAFPWYMAFDGAGNLFVADAGLPVQIRKIAVDGTITKFAELPAGVGIQGMAVDPRGGVWFTIPANQVIRLRPSGELDAVYGDGVAGLAGDGGGTVRFSSPGGIAAAADGSIYIADRGNHVIRRLTPVTIAPIQILSGNGQTGAPGSKMAAPIRLRVLSADGAPLGGMLIGVAPDPAATTQFPPFLVSTNADGVTEIKDLTLPETPGEMKFSATVLASGAVLPKVDLVVTAINRLISIGSGDGSGNPELSPNALATATGVGLAAEARTAGAEDLVDGGKLPTRLGGVCVELGDVRAPIVSVSPAAVTFIVPALAPADVAARLLLRCGQADQEATNAVTAAIRAASPAWLFWVKRPEGGPFPIQAYDAQSGTPVGSPGLEGADYAAATPGQTVRLMGTGFGATAPEAVPGQVPGAAEAPTIERAVVRIGEVELAADTVIYAGLAADQPGRYSLVVRIPDSLGDGNHEVGVRFGDVVLPRGGFLTVKRQ